MLPLQHPRRWRLAGVTVLILVLFAALMPAMWFWPEIHRLGTLQVDKWLHFTTFAGLAVWFAGQYKPSSYWRIALGLFVFGVVIEACQRAVSYRSSDLVDLLADAVGILFGLGIAMLGAGGWSMRFEQWLQARATSE